MADYEKMRRKLQAPILDVFDSDKQSNSARNSEKSESQKSIKGVKKKVNIELSEEQHNMLMKHMSKDSDHEEGGAIPVFKLIRGLSLHDPNWNKPIKMAEKTTSMYKREMFPEDSPERKAKIMKIFKENSSMNAKGRQVGKQTGLALSKVSSEIKKDLSVTHKFERAEKAINERVDKMALKHAQRTYL